MAAINDKMTSQYLKLLYHVYHKARVSSFPTMVKWADTRFVITVGQATNATSTA